MTPEIEKQLEQAAENTKLAKAILAKPRSSLVKKLAEIMAEIDFVEKTGRNEFHGYAYMKASDLAHAVRGKMAARNIIMLGSTESIQERAIPAKEGQMQLCTINVTYTVYDGDSGETLTFKTPGAGCDRSDKSVFKAITGSQKYALRSLFLIPDASDPEGAQIEKEFNIKENGKTVTKKVTVQPATSTEGPKITKSETHPAEPPQEDGVISGEVELVEIKTTSKGAPYRRVKMLNGNWYSCFDNKELAINDGGKIYMKQLFTLLDNSEGVKCAFKIKVSGKFKNIVGVKSIGTYEWDAEDNTPVIQQDAPVHEEWDYGNQGT